MNDVGEAWVEAIRAAYSTARGTRLAELLGNRVRRRDDRGIDVFSHECGRVAALEGLETDLALGGFDPVRIRRAAEEDAYDAFIHRIIEERAP